SVAGERRLLDEVGRTAQLLQIGATLVTLVVVEHRERQRIDIGRDTEAEHQQQERRAKNGKGEPDRVADQFQRLADRAGTQTAHTERRPAIGPSGAIDGYRAKLRRDGLSPRSGRLLKVK